MGPLTSGQYEGGTQLPVTYVELHCHSAYSFLDGASHPEELVARAAELGYEALALTDHDGVYGSLEFAHAAKLAGIRPITGAEVTLGGVGSPEPLRSGDAGFAGVGAGGRTANEQQVAAIAARGQVFVSAGAGTGKTTVLVERDGVVIAVQDECGGIPDDVRARVFETGYRGSSARTPDAGAGSGLGLAIVAGVARAHGGAVDVVNVDGGCRFTLRLPASPPTTA